MKGNAPQFWFSIRKSTLENQKQVVFLPELYNDPLFYFEVWVSEGRSENVHVAKLGEKILCVNFMKYVGDGGHSFISLFPSGHPGMTTTEFDNDLNAVPGFTYDQNSLNNLYTHLEFSSKYVWKFEEYEGRFGTEIRRIDHIIN